MRLRHLLHLLWIPLALLLALAALYFLAYTPRGLGIIVGRLNGPLRPLQIQIQGASGTLARGLHLDHLVVEHRRVHIELDDVTGRVSVLPLAWQTVRVPDLHAAQLLIHALPESTPHSPQAPRFLPPLMRVLANRIDIDRWRLITTSGTVLEASALSTSGVIYSDRIRLYTGALTFRAVHLRPSGEVLATENLGLSGDLHLDAQPPGEPAWTVNGRFDGDLLHLGLDASFHEPFTAQFHGEADELTRHWHWHGYSKLQRLDPRAWGAGPALGLIRGPPARGRGRGGFP